ncbi:MAG: formyltransferase family protein [bacterium]
MSKRAKMRFAFAGDRELSVKILEFIQNEGMQPLALLVSKEKSASHADELIHRYEHLNSQYIFKGKNFRTSESKQKLKELQLDYIIGIHFPYLIPKDVLNIPKIGFLNLHPAYLPYNRGWHTPSWAILDKTPIGATLHFMDEEIDCGDIILQKRLEVKPEDTADSLYQKILNLEYDVFKEAWPQLLSLKPSRHSQKNRKGSIHKKEDLLKPDIQEINLNKKIKASDLIDQLRALTTNKLSEAAYFKINKKKYFIQISIHKDDM